MMSVSRSYRRGILVVVYTVLISAVVVLAGARTGTVPPRAAQDLGDQAEKLGSFQLVERSGRQVSDADLADRVCIVSFIFTRCQLSCPRITSVMKSLQPRLEGSDVLLVSLSVDPEHDTPDVLAEYARRFEADPERWWFLTGSRRLIYDLIQRRFKLSVMENPAAETDNKAESIAHSDRLALVDRGRVVGLFDSNDSTALGIACRAGKTPIAPRLDSGFAHCQRQPQRALRSVSPGRMELHSTRRCRSRVSRPDQRESRRVRLGAPGSPRARSYRLHGTRGAHVGDLPGFLPGLPLPRGKHAVSRPRPDSLALLYRLDIAHRPGHPGVVPLVFLTLLRALQRDFSRHRLIAATTFPIWVYVSVTGVLIYLMLYHLPIADSGSALPI